MYRSGKVLLALKSIGQCPTYQGLREQRNDSWEMAVTNEISSEVKPPTPGYSCSDCRLVADLSLMVLRANRYFFIVVRLARE